MSTEIDAYVDLVAELELYRLATVQARRQERRQARKKWRARGKVIEQLSHSLHSRRMEVRAIGQKRRQAEAERDTIHTQADGLAVALDAITDLTSPDRSYPLKREGERRVYALGMAALEAYRSSQAQRRPAPGEGVE